MFDFDIKVTNLVWQSDWNGYEVGFPGADLVGLYQKETPTGLLFMYINMETYELLDACMHENY